MKKMILIGKTSAGKTTLCQNIHSLNMNYQKTQAIEFYENVIDTPGEYIENRQYYKALIMTAVDADVIALVQDCSDEENYFPPEFASIFSKPVIGIVTKIDLANNKELEVGAEEKLRIAGARLIFKISSKESFGIRELLEFLKEDEVRF